MSPSAIELATAPAQRQMLEPEEEAHLREAELAQMLEEEEKFLTAYEATLKSEDDEPVDSLFSAQQQRLLVETLYTGWTPPPNEDFPQGGHSFWGETNIAVYGWVGARPIVPDVFLSLDVSRPEFPRFKSYYVWRLGKSPDVVIEVVSNKIGGELTRKQQAYARMRVPYYVVFDPFEYLSADVLQVFTLDYASGKYQRLEQAEFPTLGLGLTLWHGGYEQAEDTYLRWVDHEGKLLPTGNEAQAQAAERAAQEAARAAQEAERAAQEAAARQEAETRAERLAAKLRELGLDPDQT